MDTDKTLYKLRSLDEEDFRPSKFTIRVKLLFIITSIVAFSLLFMNFASTFLFKSMTSVLIQEYNLSLSRLMGAKIEKDMEDFLYRTKIFSTSLEKMDQKTIENIFPGHKEIYGISVWENDDTGINIQNTVTNPESFLDSGFDEEKFLIENRLFAASQTAKLENVLTLVNLQKNFSVPVVAIIIPAEKFFTVIYVNSQYLIDTFISNRQSDTFELFLVDGKGKLILQSNLKDLELEGVVTDLKIVKKLLTSPVDNGSLFYERENREYLGSYYVSGVGGIGVISTIPLDKAFEAVYKIQRQNIILFGIVLISAFIIVFLFARTLSVPVVRLVEATEKIEKGDFHINIKSSTRDEIGILTKSFIRMARGLWEKEKIKGAFGKFVNPEMVKRAIEGKVKLGGENKICTVFFSDIRSFTNMSETREPAEVLDILNQYFTRMVKCVHDTGGVVDKFIGDAVMAHWGSLIDVDNDSRRAVLASLQMRESLMELNAEFLKKGKPVIKIGCGINTGPVIAGQIGSEERLEFTVIGDAVNLASRIEYLNKYFGTDILISESCYLRLADEFNCVKMPSVLVKGKEKPQIVYAVLGKKEDPKCPKSLEELRNWVGIEYSGKETESKMKNSTDKLVDQPGKQ